MADFNPPWAQSAERRAPTPDEISGGFPCGPADQYLFNWLFWSLQSEINKVIVEAGLTPSNDNMTQLYQAIQALIAAATGGGDVSNYLLMTQARTRLPFFAEVQNENQHLGVTSPGTGQIRIPAGITFLHRGIFPVTTILTDLPTDANKVYHLRWTPSGGFVLRDLASVVYNPGALPENNVLFDTTFDDVLFARVITNSSNVPTITNLRNSNRLESEQQQSGAGIIFTTGSGLDGVRYSATFSLGWARRPLVQLDGATGQVAAPLLHGYANRIYIDTQDRYQVVARVESDYDRAMNDPAVFVPNGQLRLFAIR